MPVEIGIVGCGAVTELCHLPAAARCPSVRIAALVDTNLDRAQTLATRHRIPQAFSDYRALIGRVDGAVVALPHVLHAPVSIDLLEHHVGVLVEKPMALHEGEALAMLEASHRSGASLTVGQLFRFFNGPRLVRKAVQEGWLGDLVEVSCELGSVYDWPVASGFFFDQELAGGGVLVDSGSHLLDLLRWCVGPSELVHYRDDAAGGVEAECEVSLLLHAGGKDVPATVLMSRLRRLGNSLRLVGERCMIEYDLISTDKVHLLPRIRGVAHRFVAEPRGQTEADAFADQLAAFGRLLQGDEAAVDPASVVPTVALIETCYDKREALTYPWDAVPPDLGPLIALA